MKSFKVKLTESRIFIRFLEIIPGLTSWSVIIAPIVLSIFNPIVVMYYIIIYDLYWFFRALNISRITLASYFKLKRDHSYDWLERCKETENVALSLKKARKELA